MILLYGLYRSYTVEHFIGSPVNLQLGYIYIYIYSRFQKRFHMERYIDIYILLLSCTCARAFVTCYCPTCEKPRFNDKFFLRRVFCSNLKRTCCFAFFFLEKCMRPATQICNDELYSWFREWEKHPAKQPSYMGSPNGRPNAMASVASDKAFLLMECIKKCAVQGPGACFKEKL